MWFGMHKVFSLLIKFTAINTEANGPSFFLTITAFEMKELVDLRMTPISSISLRCSQTSSARAGGIF